MIIWYLLNLEISLKPFWDPMAICDDTIFHDVPLTMINLQGYLKLESCFSILIVYVILPKWVLQFQIIFYRQVWCYSETACVHNHDRFCSEYLKSKACLAFYYLCHTPWMSASVIKWCFRLTWPGALLSVVCVSLNKLLWMLSWFKALF